MKQVHADYIELVRACQRGLFSHADLGRLELHVADGMAGARQVARVAPTSVIDIGSGGGVPGVQLAVELADATVTLVESQGWKAEFLQSCARQLDLESKLMVHCARVESAPAELGRERFDVGTARALAAPIVVAEYLAPLIRVGGRLMLWSTRSQAADALHAGAIEELGLDDPSLHDAASTLRTDGVIIEWPKVAPCSERFPRRIGVASRRPIR